MPVLNSFKKRILEANINLSADTIKVALLTNIHVTNIDTQEFWSNVSANEVVGTGYTAGGQALASKVVSQDNVDDEGVFDAADVTWAASTITARYAVVYKDTTVATTSPLICIIDFGTDKSSSNGNFTIQWATEGILNLN